MPCSKGEASAEGQRCPYAEHEPRTHEGWEAWDIALRCAGQLRMTQLAVIGVDFSAAFALIDALGYDRIGAANFLPACEDGMAAAINEKLSAGLKQT